MKADKQVESLIREAAQEDDISRLEQIRQECENLSAWEAARWVAIRIKHIKDMLAVTG